MFCSRCVFELVDLRLPGVKSWCVNITFLVFVNLNFIRSKTHDFVLFLIA